MACFWDGLFSVGGELLSEFKVIHKKKSMFNEYQ